MRQIRQTLHLHYQAGLSYAQVARALGVAKSTVGNSRQDGFAGPRGRRRLDTRADVVR
jgi:DNA-directed RNA polymerase specialized sigma24 family protein